MLSAMSTVYHQPRMVAHALPLRAPGPLVIIGGAEDKIGPCIILRELLRLAGGGRARVAILPLASSYPDLVGARYAALFSQLGAAETFTVDLLASGAVATADTLGALER